MSKRVLITGASSGIGRELARVFARERYELIIVARDKEALDRLAGELKADYNTETTVVDIDLTKPSAPQKVHEAAVKGNKAIDVLVNNAGIGDYGYFAEAKWEKLQTSIDLNIKALTHLTHLVLPDMIRRKNGKILNVASTASFFPGPLMSVYYATKAYVLNFSLGIREEVKQHGITVTALCPGPTRTHFQDKAHANSSNLFKDRESMSSATSVAYFGFEALMKNKPYVVHGLNRKILVFASRFAPRQTVARFIHKAQHRAKRI